MTDSNYDPNRIVITGIGMITALGRDRESTWAAIRAGTNGAGFLTGLEFIPEKYIVGTQVHLQPGDEPEESRLKSVTLNRLVTDEAVRDSGLNFSSLDPERVGCAISGHFGDIGWFYGAVGVPEPPRKNGYVKWWQQWMPNTAMSIVANQYGVRGPRMCHSVACASGLVDIMAAARAIRSGLCDVALCGSAEEIFPLFAAGFHQIRALAYDEDPKQACRPYDKNRKGFIMGEGGASFVVERLDHARKRGARIYAEIMAGKLLSEAHHVTGLDAESEGLTRLIGDTLRRARVAPEQIGYINAHGTATEQNDLVESRGIRRGFGAAADRLCVSSVKSMIGHLVNASGSVELGITALALRDGFVPPTINYSEPDPNCDLDYIPNVGRPLKFDHAMKLSLAFGGHLAAVILRRWNEPGEGRPPLAHKS